MCIRDRPSGTGNEKLPSLAASWRFQYLITQDIYTRPPRTRSCWLVVVSECRASSWTGTAVLAVVSVPPESVSEYRRVLSGVLCWSMEYGVLCEWRTFSGVEPRISRHVLWWPVALCSSSCCVWSDWACRSESERWFVNQDYSLFQTSIYSTPDISHIDQMCEIVWYVHIENKKVEVKETFLGYFQLNGKKALDITEDIIKAIEQDGLDITLCRGQGYDNASTMAGVHSGVQVRIRKLNPKALFVPCTNHSLNLCGVHSFATVSQCVTFFGTLESLYCFFSVSTHRWTILVNNAGVTVKRLSDTRWSAHYEAVKPVRANFKKIVDAIEELCDPTETVETRGAAQTLLPAVCDFSFLCFLYFWSNVLEEVNHTQKYLQIVGISFEKCVIKMRSLKIFLKDKRNEIVETALQFATNTCEGMDIPLVKRRSIRKKKTMPGEEAQDCLLYTSRCV